VTLRDYSTRIAFSEAISQEIDAAVWHHTPLYSVRGRRMAGVNAAHNEQNMRCRDMHYSILSYVHTCNTTDTSSHEPKIGVKTYCLQITCYFLGF